MFGTGATDSLACGKISQKYGLAARGRHHGRLRPAAGDDRARRQRRHDLHHRPAAVSCRGSFPRLQLYLYKLSGGAVSPANTDTSLAYVTKDNVDIYLAPVPVRGQHRRGSGVATVSTTDG